jgi:hypothetical protein
MIQVLDSSGTSFGLSRIFIFDANGKLKFSTGGSGGSASWGSITGTLSSQTDLQTALDAKFDLEDINPICKLGENINKGQAVYISSANGTNMIISKASNAAESTSSKTFGLLSASGVTNDQIRVITSGFLAGLDTSTANAAGDPVWLGTSGNLIYGLANKPVAPAHLVFIGIVTRKQSSNGEIFIKVQNGFELQELHDVDAVNPSNNDGIFYNTSTSLWEHKSIATVLGYTPYSDANPSGYITSSALSGYLTSATAASTYQTILSAASASANGYLTSTDWSTFNNKQAAITLTTTGTSGAATLVGATLNIPQYSPVGQSVNILHNILAQALTGAASPTTRYHAISGTISSLTTAYQVPLPTACTFGNFYFRIYSAQPASGSLVLTLQKNAADTASTITIAAGSAIGNYTDNTNTVSFVAGDTWQIKIVQNATSGSTNLGGYSFKLTGI